MRPLAAALLLLVALAGPALAVPREGRAYITNYCVHCGGRQMADGTRPRVGCCAADRSLPFGTRVWIEGRGTFTVHDRGGAVHGKHFDLWVAGRCPGGCWRGAITKRGVRYRIISMPKKRGRGQR